MYTPVALPFHVRALPDGTIVGISQSGDHAFLASDELAALRSAPEQLPLERRAELTARFFMVSHPVSPGLRRLLASRIATKHETVEAGPSLHVLVPTLQCAHSCRYCQVSRSLDDLGHTMSDDDLDRACDTILSSPARTLSPRSDHRAADGRASRARGVHRIAAHQPGHSENQGGSGARLEPRFDVASVQVHAVEQQARPPGTVSD